MAIDYTPPLRAAARQAAVEVATYDGTPGTMTRIERLRSALDEATQHDTNLAVLIAAAVWLDRYGSSGAPVRLAALKEEVRRHQQPDMQETACPCGGTPIPD